MTGKDGWVSAFAPATIANFGSGFDAFAAAVALAPAREPADPSEAGRGKAGRAAGFLLGDRVSVRRTKGRGVRILSITGDGGRLPISPIKNTASVAAAAVLRRARARFGLDLVLYKGLPLASGLGSSAASAAAGAYAAALAVAGGSGEILKKDLLESALAGEHVADGAWHGDNVFASLLGGGVLVVSTRPAVVVPLGSPRGLRLVAVHPDVALETRRARAALPRRVPLEDATAQAGQFGAFVAAWTRADRCGIGLGLADRLAEPHRARLVPGFSAARLAALEAGAYGATFAGAGPSVVAVTRVGAEKRVGRAIARAFAGQGLRSDVVICRIDAKGARPVRFNMDLPR